MKKSIKILFFTMFLLSLVSNYSLAAIDTNSAVVYTLTGTSTSYFGNADKILLYDYPDGTTTTFQSAADAGAFQDKTVIVCNKTDITSNTTVGSSTSLIVTKGGSFNITSATLYILGPFQAGLYKVFNGGTVSFGTITTGLVNEFHPEWWGANFQDTTTDASGAMQAAINAATTVGGVVQLPAGTATTGVTPLTLKPNVRIVGAGRGLTTINFTGTGTKTAFTTGTVAKEYMGIEKLTVLTAGVGILLHDGRHNIFRDLEIIGTGTTNTVCLQLESGSWENSFYDCIFDGNDAAGTRSTKGVYQATGTNTPNINRFENCIFKNLHYGFLADGGYDTCLVAPRFVKTRYHMVIGDDANRFKCIASSHEANNILQPALQFTNGSSTVSAGDVIWQGTFYGTPTTTGSATVSNVEIDSGTWTSGNAAGFLYLYDKRGTLTTGLIKIGTSSGTAVATSPGTSTNHFVLAKISSKNKESSIMFPSILEGDNFNIHDYGLNNNGTLNGTSSFTYNYRDSWNLKSRQQGLNEPIFNFQQVANPSNDRIVRIRSRSGADSTTKMLQIVKGDTDDSSLTELAVFYGNGNFVLNSGTAINKYVGTLTSLQLPFGTISPNSVATYDVPLTGVDSTDSVFVAPSGSPGTNLIWSARCKGTTTVEIRLANPTSGTVTTTNRNWRASVFKH